MRRHVLIITADDKQAKLLSQEAGHFSLVRALHMADFITELNGTHDLSRISSPFPRWIENLSDFARPRSALLSLGIAFRMVANENIRLLRCYVRLLVPPLLHPRRPQ